MTDKDIIKLGNILVQRALDNDHAKFVLIVGMDHYKAVKAYRSAMRKIIKGFKQMKKTQGKLQPWDTCITFYKDEIKTINDMIKEFKTYLWGNRHTIQTLLGRIRTEDEMVDYRTLPISLF